MKLKLMAAVALLALPVTATSATSPKPVYQPPQSYYLALGDSMTYGFQPTKAKPGAKPSDFNTGYVDVFAAKLRKLAPNIDVVNYGCPGESTVTFVRGGCPAFKDGIRLHDAFRGSQLKAALSFLRAHKGDVSPVTLALWGNDVFPLSEKGKRAPQAISLFASRLSSILEQLRAAAPDAEIIVLGAWTPEPDGYQQAQPLYRSLDTAIARSATASRARVAKMFTVFGPKARLCALTYTCSKHDPHPNDMGYRAMAGAFQAASGYPTKQ
jgi:lysophospholipase L1-like esterase